MANIEIKISHEDANAIATMVVAKLRATKPNTPITYTVEQVADISNKHRNTVSRHIKLGLLKANRVGKGYLISEESLKEYLNN